MFAITVAAVMGLLTGVYFLLEIYPWQTIYADFEVAKESKFLTPWPQSAFEEEMQERRRLKRFARPEVRRRFGIQLRRMDALQSSLYDPFIDTGLTKQSPEFSVGPSPGPLFELPSFSIKRRVNPETVFATSYFAIPRTHGVEYLEGLLVDAGDDLRMNIPLSPNRRSVEFTVLARSTGSLRAYLGQFTWVRNFTEQDIHRKVKISIPINDTSATSLRFTSQGVSLVVLNFAVVQWDRSGRNPIRLSSDGVWKESELEKGNTRAQPSAGAGMDGQVTDLHQSSDDPVMTKGDSGLKKPGDFDKPPEESGGFGDNAGSAEPKDPSENKERLESKETADEKPVSDERKAESGSPGGLSPDKATVNTDSEPAPSKGENSAAKEGESAPLDPIDPIEQVSNAVLVEPGNTVALGYNLLMLQLGALDQELLLAPNRLQKVAPELAKLFSVSRLSQLMFPASKGTGPISEASLTQRNVFFQSTFPAYPVLGSESHPDAFIDSVSESDSASLPLLLRNFGYQVAYFTPDTFLNLGSLTKRPRSLNEFERRWLSRADGEFAKGNREIERLNTPATGLDAIFQTDNAPYAPGFDEQELLEIGRFSEGVGSFEGHTPDFRANSILCPDAGPLYLPSLVQMFQNWTQNSFQSRFFAHLVLESHPGESRASLKDLIKAVRTDGARALFSLRRAKESADQVMLNKALEQIFSTLQARKITHRTLILWTLPLTKKGETVRWLSGIRVPGLEPKTPNNFAELPKVSLLKNTKLALGLVGIPTENLAPLSGKGVEYNRRSLYRRLKLFVKASEFGECSPVTWKGSARLLGLKATVPISFVRSAADVIGFEVNPCAWKGKYGEVEWYQRAEPPAREVQLRTASEIFFGSKNIFQSVEQKKLKIYFGSEMSELKEKYLERKLRGEQEFDPAAAAEGESLLDQKTLVQTFDHLSKLKSPLKTGNSSTEGSELDPMLVWLGSRQVDLDRDNSSQLGDEP